MDTIASSIEDSIISYRNKRTSIKDKCCNIHIG